jgi:hypothetical protein
MLKMGLVLCIIREKTMPGIGGRGPGQKSNSRNGSSVLIGRSLNTVVNYVLSLSVFGSLDPLFKIIIKLTLVLEEIPLRHSRSLILFTRTFIF